MQKPIKIVLEGERPVSLNAYYAGMHWTKRKAEADRVHWMIHILNQKEKPLLKHIVDIAMHVYFKSRPLDADNIMAKMYIDGLKGKVIVDDSPKYVRSVTTVSLTDRENPRVEIMIQPCGE